jgi:hypothetical protein
MRAKRRPAIIIGISVGALILVTAVAGLALHVAGGRSIGADLEELNGQTHTTNYAATSDTPVRDIPKWFPRSARNVTVEVPGPKSKSPGGIQVDADVPTTFSLPSTCRLTGQSFPWVGWSSLNVPAASLERCAGWITTVEHRHLYAWKA